MAIVTVVVWMLRQSTKRALLDHDGDRRLTTVEAEILRVRERQHAMIAWQQQLFLELDERYYTRREIVARDETESARRRRRINGDEP